MKLMFSILVVFFCAQLCTGQTEKDSIYHKKIAEKGVKFIPVYGGKYKVFTQKVGKGKIKLLLLHGGPGNTHEYFENFPENLKGKNIEIYYYDQLGSYFSDQPNDTSIWNVIRFVEEVEEVRKGLNLEKFYILGHSWGAMLGQLYAAKYPDHLKGLILSNVPPEIRDIQKRDVALNEWRDDVHRKISSLPPFRAIPSTRVDSIREGSRANASFQYADLKRVYEYKRDSIIRRTNTFRLSEVMPEPMMKNILHLDRKMRDESGMYQKIFKPDYPAADEKIKCPVLILGGEYDRWFPKIYPEMKQQFTQTRVRVYLCPNGSHFSMWDDTQNYFREVVRFLMDVENNEFDPAK